MLKQLTIKNYALIRHLEMQPADGLNVITGETGAGKSIMLGAVGLLLGNRADTKVLWDENEKCVTEGEFDIAAYGLQKLFKAGDIDYEDNTIIRREVSSNGKSRAFINDTPVTLEMLKKIGNRLMDVHSQHETLDLGTKSFQLELIDSFAGNQKLTVAYGIAWNEFEQARVEFNSLQQEAASLKQESDFILFQLDELTKADLKENEQEALESELKIQEHAEEIKNRFNAIIDLLGRSEYSVSSALAEAKANLNSIVSFSNTYGQLFQRLESVKYELDDILREIESEEGRVEFDASHFEEVKTRLSLIYQLLQKHRSQDVDELIRLKESLQEKADKTINLDERLTDLRKKLEQAERKLGEQAELLSKSRTKVFSTLAKQITELLKELGIPEAQLKVEHETTTPGPSGTDSIELLFSANKGISPRPLAQVASGGEFSRLMFCIKYIMAEKAAMPTLILDEIDTGVSGEIAIRLGSLMKTMAQRHQVIAITHLPQIAAKGDAHYFVYKDNSEKKTVSLMKKLDDRERVEEIAKMIGGAKPTATAVENARELINR